MTDIDEIFSKMPFKENVGIDDAERQMKFCIIAHIAPSRAVRDEKSVTKEECYLAFKKIYRVLDTLPSIERCDDVFVDVPEDVMNGFEIDSRYEKFGRFILRFDVKFVHLKDIMKFVYLMKVCVGDCSWVDIMRNGSSYANHRFWFRIGLSDSIEHGVCCGLPTMINDTWVRETYVIEISQKMMSFFKHGIFQR